MSPLIPALLRTACISVDMTVLRTILDDSIVAIFVVVNQQKLRLIVQGGLLGLLCFLGSCRQSPKVERSIYHWKTRFAPTAFEKGYLKDLGVTRIYVKYFDVDWPEGETQAVPQAKVQFAELPTQEVIPTIFITNRAMRDIGQANAPAMADRILKLIRSLHPKELPAFKEVQIDCDWSQGTKEAYFSLLKRLDQRLDSVNVTLSATIRLHQLKYPKQTGVPPVDRGMLMFYNMGDLENPQEDNSILNIAEGKKYLDNASTYALPLDAALPIFAWGVLIRRGKPIKLLNNLRKESTVDKPWFSSLSANVLQVDTSHYFWGHYLYPEDEIRLEEVEPTSLTEAAILLHDRLKREDRSLILYHLDSLTLTHYARQTLDAVYSTFD